MEISIAFMTPQMKGLTYSLPYMPEVSFELNAAGVSMAVQDFQASGHLPNATLR